MQKGKYMADRRQPRSDRPAKPSKRYESAASRKRSANTARNLMIIAICVLFVILVGCGVLLFSGNRSSLEGVWDLDGVTVYRFDSKNTGALVLPSGEYAFVYTKDGNSLSIDFASERAKDAQYTFAVKGDVLTLVGGTDTTNGTYYLTRME